MALSKLLSAYGVAMPLSLDEAKERAGVILDRFFQESDEYSYSDYYEEFFESDSEAGSGSDSYDVAVSDLDWGQEAFLEFRKLLIIPQLSKTHWMAKEVLGGVQEFLAAHNAWKVLHVPELF